jgi:hypothetical protein
MKHLLASVFCSLTFPATIVAQQKPSDVRDVTSTVSGHVYCADTNAPARMATVILQPADAIDAITPGENKNIASSGEAARTLLDGSFTIHHVKPGTYYVIASAPGYVSPLASIQVRPQDDPATKGSEPKKPSIPAPRITVEANLPVAVNVSIERGASVSGTVQYDDGSPASGVQVALLTRFKESWQPIPSLTPVANSGSYAQTDDEGHYRISGLPAGKYVVRAQLQLDRVTYRTDEHGSGYSTSSGYSMDFYSGHITRQKDAVSFDLTPGEERGGTDIEIPISRLHTVRGKVLAAHDGHVLNSGSLQLLFPDDRSVAANVSLSHDDDDTFTFGFVPEGDYVLSVQGAADMEYRDIPNPPGSMPPTRPENHTVRAYGPAEQAIHVTGDLSGITIAAPDLPPQKAQAAQ